MKYVIKTAYDGSDFSGWQIQPNARTVQEELEKAVFAALGERCAVTASGRTDAGVHALCQICQFSCETTVPAEKLAAAINRNLPADISVLASAAAPENFDCNRSAKRKTYVYRAYFSPCRNPLKDRYSVWLKGEPNIEKMQDICSLFVGKHDFKAYCASGSQVKTTVREIYSLTAEKKGDDVSLTVTGNGFLYNMVRTIAGTVFAYAAGALDREKVARSIQNADRSCVGKTMPPQGLFLYDVDYGINLFG